MNNRFDFNILKRAWMKLIQNNITSIIKVAPGFENPQKILLKNINDDDSFLQVQFSGFENAVNDSREIQAAKRVIVDWLKKISTSVQIVPSTPTELSVKISKDLKFSENEIPETTETIIIEKQKPVKHKKLVNIVRSKFE